MGKSLPVSAIKCTTYTHTYIYMYVYTRGGSNQLPLLE